MEWPFVGRDELLRRLLDRLSQPAPVLLAGPAGVGKTRLVEEIVAVHDERALPVLEVRATSSDRALPLGVFSHLAPPGMQARNRVELLGMLREDLLRRAAEGLLIVEDTHNLDESSAALLHHVAGQKDVRVLLTMRTGDPRPAAIVALWKDERVERFDLEPLCRADARRLVETALDGAVDEITHAELWRLSRGNPLYLREVLLSALHHSHLREDHGTWRLSHGFAPAPRLVELIEDRLRGLSEQSRETAALIAVAQEIEVDLLGQLVPEAAVRALEQHDLVTTHVDGRRVRLRLAHPVYTETLRHGMSSREARRLVRLLAAAVEKVGARRRDDLLRLGHWIATTGWDAGRGVRTRVAQHALAVHDPDLAEEVLRPLWEVDGHAASGVLLGMALAAQGRPWAADDVLRTAIRRTTDSTTSTRGRLARARNLFLGCGRPQEAHAELAALRADVADVGWRHEIDGLAALFAALSGDLRGAAAIGDRVLDGEAAEVQAHATIAMSSLAHVMLGRLNDAQRQLDAVVRAGTADGHVLPMTDVLFEVNQVLLDAHAGRIGPAVAHVRDAYHTALDDRQPRAAGVWATIHAWLLVFRGRLESAERAAVEATDLIQEFGDPLDLETMARGLAAVAASSSGHADRSEVHRQMLPEGPHLARSRVYVDRVDISQLVAKGRLDEAARVAVTAADRAIDSDHLVWAALLLHDAVRIGRAALVVDQLEEISQACEGDLVPVLLEHARALCEEDGAALEQIADRFDELEVWLYGVEASAQAIQWHKVAGDPRAAAHAERATVARLRRLETVATPCIPLNLVSLEPLTPREEEVAIIAASGHTSRAIAADLGLSPRTVDNHLSRVYRKLGVHTREELADALSSEGPGE